MASPRCPAVPEDVGGFSAGVPGVFRFSGGVLCVCGAALVMCQCHGILVAFRQCPDGVLMLLVLADVFQVVFQQCPGWPSVSCLLMSGRLFFAALIVPVLCRLAVPVASRWCSADCRSW